jgi:hypothetical protein
MSIFSNYKKVENNEPEIEAPVYEGYDCEFNGDLIMIQEGFEDQLAIIESLYNIDMAELEYKKEVKGLTEAAEIEAKTTEFESALEGMIGNTWEKIKAFFTTMWGKMKAFFKTAVSYIDDFVKSNKDFVTKYESQIKDGAAKNPDFTYVMYKYNDAAIKGDNSYNFLEKAQDALKEFLPANVSTETSEDLNKKIGDLIDKKEDTMNKLRGTYVGESNLNSSEYEKALFNHFRKGEKGPKKININEVISVLKSGNGASFASGAAKFVDKLFIDEIIKINTWAASSDSAKKGSEDKDLNKKFTALANLAHKYASAFSEARSIALQYFRAWKQALTERDTAYRSICVKII